MKIQLIRTYCEKITIGVLHVEGKINCMSMELPWHDNERNKSCIPEGLYQVIKQSATNTRPYNFFRLMFVAGRNGILIHKITYVKDLRGCIGVGRHWIDLNNDGIPDLTHSTHALEELYKTLPDQFTLEIKS